MCPINYSQHIISLLFLRKHIFFSLYSGFTAFARETRIWLFCLCDLFVCLLLFFLCRRRLRNSHMCQMLCRTRIFNEFVSFTLMYFYDMQWEIPRKETGQKRRVQHTHTRIRGCASKQVRIMNSIIDTKTKYLSVKNITFGHLLPKQWYSWIVHISAHRFIYYISIDRNTNK